MKKIDTNKVWLLCSGKVGHLVVDSIWFDLCLIHNTIEEISYKLSVDQL